MTIIDSLFDLQPELGKIQVQLRAILNEALASADPYHLVNHAILLSNGKVCIGENQYDSTKRMILMAMGKASLAMNQAVMDKIPNFIARGVCVFKTQSITASYWPQIRLVQGGHPIPDLRSLEAGNTMHNCLTGLTADDLVLVMISGGASALVASPVDGISLDDLKVTNQSLIRSGATINEMNAVRKHLERLKGGGMLRAASPAKVEALILSDVIGDDISVIASGPTSADATTFFDALNVIERYRIEKEIPLAVLAHLKTGNAGILPETIKPGDSRLQKVSNRIIGSNSIAINAALLEAHKQRFRAECVSREMVGEARQAADWFLDECQKYRQYPGAFMAIAGGETTVTVRGNGKGGRNLELALATVKRMAYDDKGVLINLATDGEDGPTDAAGAVVTSTTMNRARKLGLNPDDYLMNNDAYTFFEKVGGLIKIGSTGTNVNDLTFYFRVE
ncbi:MAG: glycerate kinase [Anaerolineaceae bacterium]